MIKTEKSENRINEKKFFCSSTLIVKPCFKKIKISKLFSPRTLNNNYLVLQDFLSHAIFYISAKQFVAQLLLLPFYHLLKMQFFNKPTPYRKPSSLLSILK